MLSVVNFSYDVRYNIAPETSRDSDVTRIAYTTTQITQCGMINRQYPQCGCVGCWPRHSFSPSDSIVRLVLHSHCLLTYPVSFINCWLPCVLFAADDAVHVFKCREDILWRCQRRTLQQRVDSRPSACPHWLHCKIRLLTPNLLLTTHFIIIIIIIIISSLVSTYENKNSTHYKSVINRSHKNSLNNNVFKSFLKCGCELCAWSLWKSIPGSRASMRERTLAKFRPQS